ncbi:MAG: glycoside hydrolase family 31 protein, partial [Oscillospiraceae bacterium]
GTNFSAMTIPAREFTPISGKSHGITLRFESDPKEKLYGMGQYQQEILNLKGTTLELAQRNSQISIPFLLSDLGYGFLWNNPAIGTATFGINKTLWQAQSAPQLDYWITAGDSPAQVMHQYSVATGLPSAMPHFATGFWQCKMRYRTQEELLSVAREYKRRELPISVIIIDFFHWPNQGVWDFDKKYWPNPKAMVAELEEMGIKLFVSVWPTVDPDSPNYQTMLERGFLTHTERGGRTQLECNGHEVFFDATNPDARKFVWDIIKKNYYDLGIKNYWLDAAEPETLPYHYDNLRYHLGTSLEVGNSYPFYYGKTVYDGLIAAGETEVLSLERCAWAGSQRIGTLAWSGDIFSDFETLRRQIVAGLHMSVAGIPWWTTDIGGFTGGNPDDPQFRELLIRWFQYGAFCPVFRLHGARIPEGEPLSQEMGGGMAASGAANEVWSYGDEAYGILKSYLLLREKLRPYIQGLMDKCHEDGTPPMRPVFYDFPKDANAWDLQDQFLFGPDLLISPVVEAGALSREVYLPKGSRWIEVATGKAFAGGQQLICDAPLARMPLFLRESSSLNAKDLKI